MTLSSFGEHLRRLRETAGLTQEELAERAGLSRDAVSALERGHRRQPHPRTVRALAVGLGLSERATRELGAAARRRAETSVPPLSPPVRMAHAPPPIPPTPLIGRRRELAELRRLLTAGGARLVTLTGPGGVGKTRLALELARSLGAEFPGGVTFIALTSVQDPALVLPTIAEAFGVRDAHGRLLSERIKQALRGQRRLLVLDNLELLLWAASPVAELLAGCPELSILATSRATLRLSGEQLYSVPPLATPRSGEPTTFTLLAASDAVALFDQRARAAIPDFRLTEANASAVAAICARVDGLPLAVELAAARVRMLSPETLLARLDAGIDLLTGGAQDNVPRLRSMRAAIAWSYDLLDPEEQALFRRLAVFADGFTLEAAEAVADAMAAAETAVPAVPAFVLDGVASLIDKSLLAPQDGDARAPRLGMLATIQEFGRERLAATGEGEATRRAHADWFLGLAEDAWPAFRQRADQAFWLDRLEAERGNLRAALRWLDESGDAASLLRLAGALFWFWYIRGPLAEGRRWLERALAAHAGQQPSAARARALVGAALLAHFQDDEAEARTWLELAEREARDLGDPWLLAFALLLLGIVAEDRGDYRHAGVRFAESLALFQRANDLANAGLALNHLGVAAWGEGDLQRATELCEEALALQRASNDAWGAANSLGYLGLLAGERGEHGRAAVFHRESLRLRWETGASEDVAGSLADLAALAARVDRPEPAARLFAAAAEVREQAGRRSMKLPERAVFERAEATARAALGAESFAEAQAAGRRLSREQAMAEAIALADDIAGAVADPDDSGASRRAPGR
jgi:predicted ATPase/DNA-binding XRE family transcriptional regulator/tetratricopeptide (TPR) repeat protein